MENLRLEELDATNVVAANNLSLKPGQEAYVVPVSNSIAEAYVNQSTSWPRVVYSGDELVGFIMANFDQDAPREEVTCCVLRMNVSASAQGKGVGTYALEQIAAEGQRRGFSNLYAVWESGELGPEDFFTRLGFEIIGETEYGEQIGRKPLS